MPNQPTPLNQDLIDAIANATEDELILGLARRGALQTRELRSGKVRVILHLKRGREPNPPRPKPRVVRVDLSDPRLLH